jgi:hypothetical protein
MPWFGRMPYPFYVCFLTTPHIGQQLAHLCHKPTSTDYTPICDTLGLEKALQSLAPFYCRLAIGIPSIHSMDSSRNQHFYHTLIVMPAEQTDIISFTL